MKCQYIRTADILRENMIYASGVWRYVRGQKCIGNKWYNRSNYLNFILIITTLFLVYASRPVLFSAGERVIII